MSKTRDFVEEIDAHALPEFGGFMTYPYKRAWVTGVEVRKTSGNMVHSKVVGFKEIDRSQLSGCDLANLVMDMMNDEWDEHFGADFVFLGPNRHGETNVPI